MNEHGKRERTLSENHKVRDRLRPPCLTVLRRSVVVLMMWLAIGSRQVPAQGTLTVLRTGGGSPLVTTNVPLGTVPNLSPPLLAFKFGFATDEVFSTGQFLDSFTVTLHDGGQTYVLVYVTLDASGTLLAPPTPGALTIDPQTINMAAIAFPSLQPVFVNQVAFQLTAPIPAELVALGQPLRLTFDLFDNLNSTRSLGWFDDARLVPEPSAGMLALLGVLLCVVLKRARSCKQK